MSQNLQEVEHGSGFGAGLSTGELDALLAVTPDFEQRMHLYARRARYEGKAVTNLAVAENVLLYDSLKKHVFSKLNEVGQDNLKYIDPYGTRDLRERVATFLRRSLDADVDTDHIWGTAGVASALECVATALSEGGVVRPGDPVLIPTPFWQGFRWSFEQRPQLVCVPVHPEPHVEERRRFTLTLDDIKREYWSDKHRLPKLLVLTNPNNPLGINYDRKLLEQIYEWVLSETDMHIISDEIYRHSQIRSAKPEFVSALALDAYQGAGASPSKQRERKDRVHVVWGFAKDFGLSGFRTGFLVSTSPLVERVMRGSSDTDRPRHSLSWFSPFDSLKDLTIRTLMQAEIDGRPYPAAAMEVYREALTESFDAVSKALTRNGIPFVREGGANTAQFFWVDLQEHLPKENGEAFGGATPFREGELHLGEHRLWRHIREEAEVQLLPGGTLSCPWPGYFRLCYTAEPVDKVVDAVNRIGAALKLNCP